MLYSFRKRCGDVLRDVTASVGPQILLIEPSLHDFGKIRAGLRKEKHKLGPVLLLISGGA